MFYNYEIKKEGGKEYLYLYLDYNNEFSKELLDNKKRNKETNKKITNSALEYINKNKIKFNGDTVRIIVGGIIVFNLILSSALDFFPNESTIIDSNNNEPGSKYIVEEPNEDDYIAIDDDNVDIDLPVEDNPPIEEEQPTIPPKTPVEKAPPKKELTPPKEPAPIEEPIKEESPITQEPKEVEEDPVNDIFVTLYRSNGIIEELPLEDYIIGVVSAEMPASFHNEALKTQSVAARTYALKRIEENKTLTDTNYHQSYKDPSQLKQMWGAEFNKYFTKIRNAVDGTKGEYLAYNNYYIDALYHSTSNGKTEDPIYVWGGSYPYLKSVDSHWDISASSYLRETSKPFNEVSSLLGFDFNAETNVQIVSKTISDRVNEIIIGDNIYKGTEIRDLFGLRSSDFDISVLDNTLLFTTRGYGHGVGMSQYGANGMAKEGHTYRQILNHYYPNTKILVKSL